MTKGPKTTTTQQQNQNYSNTASYGYMQAPEGQDVQALRAWRPQMDQGLGYQYANARNDLKSSFASPLGGASTAQMRDRQLRTNLRQLNQDESQAFRGAATDINQQRYGQLAGLAALTRPDLVQTGSSGSGTMSGTGTSQQSGGLGQQLLGAGLQVGSSALL